MSRVDAELDWFGFANDLNAAVFRTNKEMRVGRQTELRARFNAPDLTIRYMGHFQIINVDGHEITIGAMATDEQIATEIERMRGPRPPPLPTEKPKMSITGLRSGAFKAMLEEMKAEIGNVQSQGVADVKAASVQAATEIRTTVDNVKAKIKSEVADALQDFSEFTNGGPA